MENAVIERVNIVVRSKRFTKKALASTLGIGESLLGKKLNGSITMDLATIIGILELFNDIDANWLLLGRGAMCIDGKECIGKLDVRKIRMSLSQSLTEFAKPDNLLIRTVKQLMAKQVKVMQLVFCLTTHTRNAP